MIDPSEFDSSLLTTENGLWCYQGVPLEGFSATISRDQVIEAINQGTVKLSSPATAQVTAQSRGTSGVGSRQSTA